MRRGAVGELVPILEAQTTVRWVVNVDWVVTKGQVRAVIRAAT